MSSLTDIMAWYRTSFHPLGRDEELSLSGPDAERVLVTHCAYQVVRGLVLRRRKVTLKALAAILDEMQFSAREWMKSGREMPCAAYMLEDVDSRYSVLAEDRLLVDSHQFVSADSPVGKESSHGGERNTLLDLLDSTVAGRAGTSLSPDVTSLVAAMDDGDADSRLASRIRRDGLVYDPDLGAYVKAGKTAERKRKVKVVRREVDAGIFSYSNEAMASDEKWLESRSAIRSSKIEDRIVAQSKAARKRYRKSYRGQFPSAPAPGRSAATSAVPRPCSSGGAFDFRCNKMIDYRLPFRCLACCHLPACSSWLDAGYFSSGIAAPAACTGPHQFVGSKGR